MTYQLKPFDHYSRELSGDAGLQALDPDYQLTDDQLLRWLATEARSITYFVLAWPYGFEPFKQPTIALHGEERSWGAYSALRNQISVHEHIARFAPKRTVRILLAHELAHAVAAPEFEDHGPRWCSIMARMGLTMIDDHVQMSRHDIEPGSPFDNWVKHR
jgi:hypothetical protein